MTFSRFLAQELLDHVWGTTTRNYTSPTNIFVGLSSTTPTEAGGNITEEAAGGYVRVSTAAADWTVASAADPSLVDNATVITFPTATADWVSGADLTHFVLFDMSTGGNFLAFGALTTAKPVLDSDTASFAIGDLNITLT